MFCNCDIFVTLNIRKRGEKSRGKNPLEVHPQILKRNLFNFNLD